MNEDHKRIIISRLSEYRQTDSSGNPIPPLSPGNRWGTYIMLVPVVALMAVLGIFFFAAFLALFAIAAMGIGLRFWWMRRKFHQSLQAEEAASVDIEDAQIIEETEISKQKFK